MNMLISSFIQCMYKYVCINVITEARIIFLLEKESYIRLANLTLSQNLLHHQMLNTRFIEQ